MKDDRTIGEKVSDHVAQFGGSWKFIIIFGFLLVCWILLNTLAVFDVIAFDRHPYILLNLVLSFVAAFQAPFIMMSQNRTEKKTDEAYRFFFNEIKELVKQDLEVEQEIVLLENEISKELQELKIKQDMILDMIKTVQIMQFISKDDQA